MIIWSSLLNWRCCIPESVLLLRRAGQAGGSYLVCGPVSMDKNQMKVFLNKEEISLGSLEYQLLAALLEHKNHTLTRQKLLELLWDANGNFVRQYLTVPEKAA